MDDDELEVLRSRRRPLANAATAHPPMDLGGVIPAQQWASRVSRDRIGWPGGAEHSPPRLSRRAARPSPCTAPNPPMPHTPEFPDRPFSSQFVGDSDLTPVDAQLHYVAWPQLFAVTPARSYGRDSRLALEGEGCPAVDFYRERCHSITMSGHRVPSNSGVVHELAAASLSGSVVGHDVEGIPKGAPPVATPPRPPALPAGAFPIVRAIFDNMLLGDKGVVPVLDVMKRCVALRKLSLRGNNLHDGPVELLITDTLVVTKGEREDCAGISAQVYTDISPDLALRHRSLTELDLADNEFRMSAGKSLYLFFCRVGSPQIERINLHPSPMLNIGLIHKFDHIGEENTKRNVEERNGIVLSPTKPKLPSPSKRPSQKAITQKFQPKPQQLQKKPKQQLPQERLPKWQCFWQATFCF